MEGKTIVEKPSDEDFFAVEENDEKDASVLNKKIREVMDIEQGIELAENQLTELKEKRLEILRYQMPGLMQEMGTELAQDPETGYRIIIEDSADGLPKEPEKRIPIYEALEPLGIEEILKSSIEIKAGRGSVEAQVFRLLLEEDFDPLEEEYNKKNSKKSDKFEDEDVLDAIETLKEAFDFNSLQAKIALAPHPATFKSWCKEHLSAGRKEPFDKAGMWHGKIAKISKAKG